MPGGGARLGEFGFAFVCGVPKHLGVKAPALLVAAVLLLAGCATTPPRAVLATPGRNIVATGFEPLVRGSNVGTTIFQNRSWKAAPGGFDANELATAVATRALTNPVEVVDGRGAGLAIEIDHHGWTNANDGQLTAALSTLGEAKNVDRVVLLTTGTSPDWIYGTNQPLTGLGLYRREVFGMKRLQVYGVFQLRVFDCRQRKFTAGETLPGAREVYGVEWHEDWPEFPAAEQRRLVAAWAELVTEQTNQLLTKAGLANLPAPAERPLAERLLFKGNRPKSWLPEGNVLTIPPGVSRARAHTAVLNGLKARGWELVSQTEAQVVGRHRDGKKEAEVSARVSEREIELIADDHEVAPDGSSTAASFPRWHRNLKESIYRDLLDAADAEPVPTDASH